MGLALDRQGNKKENAAVVNVNDIRINIGGKLKKYKPTNEKRKLGAERSLHQADIKCRGDKCDKIGIWTKPCDF